MKYLILLLAISSFGCAPLPMTNQVADHGSITVDPAFIPYVKQFETYYGHSISISITFVSGSIDGASDRLGETRFYNDGYVDILILRDYWDAVPKGREELIFHELGHAILHRDHDDRILSNGIPESNMNTYALSPDLYWANHDYYINELFHPLH